MNPTRYLIVNGDDFGANRGINRGIIEAHTRGILTSTSLLVDSPWSAEAAELARNVSQLGIGLHVDLASRSFETCNALDNELQRQFLRFRELLGRSPTHLDSHHNVHRRPELLPCFLEFAEQNALPLREHSPVRYFPKFYGRWNGEEHLEQISVESLLRMLEREIQEGVTELSCHPGFVDADFHSGYSLEREEELRTLCHAAVRNWLVDRDITLINYSDLTTIPVHATTTLR
jgi:predicted glycoside hydrolase/deacetylase ChbG (UPF0249 family)